MSMASWTSPRVSVRTLPISRVMSFANSSLRCTSSSAARNRISARFGAGTSRHVLYASLAASTAAFTSSSIEDTNIPINSSVFAGLRFSYAFPLRDSSHSPLMKFLKTLGATAVAILPPGAHLVDLFASGTLRNAARATSRGDRILPSPRNTVKPAFSPPIRAGPKHKSHIQEAAPSGSNLLDENDAPKVQWLTHMFSGGGVPLPDRPCGGYRQP